MTPKTTGRTASIRWPRRHRWPARVAALVPLLDLAALLLVTLLFGLWVTGPLTGMSAVLAPVLLHDRHFSEQVWRSQWRRLAQTHAWRIVLFAVVIGVLAWLSRPPHAAADIAGAWTTTAPAVLIVTVVLILTSLTRMVAAWTVQRLRAQGRLTEVVAVVGDGPVARRLVAELARAPAGSIELLGVFDEDTRGQRRWPVASIEALMSIAARRRIDWIVLALPDARDDRIRRLTQRLVQRLGALGIPMGRCAPHVGLADPELEREGSAPADSPVDARLSLGLLAQRPIGRWQAVFKDVTDKVLALVLLLVLAPLLAVIVLAIRLDSPGPILFRQRRHALDNREFDILKFRTMQGTSDAPDQGLQQTRRGDVRITRVGRLLRATSLDELPQLLNVLAGSMSLVGPRPHAVDMRTEARLGAEITARYAHRHRVKPGITGWAQVNGARGATDTAAQLRRRVELDLHYIAHWSPLLDLRILLRTAGVVLRRTNAY